MRYKDEKADECKDTFGAMGRFVFVFLFDAVHLELNCTVKFSIVVVVLNNFFV